MQSLQAILGCCLTDKDDVVWRQGHELRHDIIPQRHVEDAEGLYVDSRPIVERELPNVLLQDVYPWLVPHHVLALKWDVCVRCIGVRPLLHTISMDCCMVGFPEPVPRFGNGVA